MANTNPPDDRFYRPATLKKAFGFTSIIMMVATIWMIMDDYGKEWKGYQREFMSLQKKKVEAQIEEAKTKIDPAKLKEATESLAKAEEGLKSRQTEIDKITKELGLLQTKEKLATANFQGEKAKWDVEKYEHEAHYGHKIAEGEKELSAKGKKSEEALAKHWSSVLALRNLMNEATAAREGKERELDAANSEKTKAEKQIKVLHAEVDLLEAAKANAELTITKLIRSSPIMDMANPVFRLQQIVLPTIRDDIFFAKVQKVDRCTTCHMAIDTPGFENEPQPFRTHPRLDVMLGSRSPHPIDKIGCTVCHEGRGQATEFSRTAHTPQNEHQKKEWEKKYGWHEMHHVIEKMIPLQHAEGKCRVCHRQTEYVGKAERLNTSTQLIRSAGCYGCHRIEGWDHIRKPAPSLKRVKGKLTRDWIVKWVRNPRAYNEFARMPNVFHLSNITTEEFKGFQEAEIQAISDYILAQSESYAPNFRVGAGSAERGKEIFKTVGCLGCHQIDDFGRPHGRWTRAPDLSTVGSKVSKDWLNTWLKNPRHYWDETTMPSLRLSDSEVADLSSYLLSKRNAQFDSADTGKADVETQKKVLRMYLLRDPKLAPATNERVDKVLADLKPHDVAMKLGEAAVTRYGCYGCHEMKGYEKTQGIGKDLSEEGSQPINKFDFGLLHIEHSNVAWFDKKLEDPRVFDHGVVKEYLDLLRMPDYQFGPEDRGYFITALLGMTSQEILPPAAKKMAARDTLSEETARIIHKYNCQGCHIAEGLHSPLPDGHPRWEEHEKRKYATEGRIFEYFSEDPALGPPTIITEGARLQTDWAHQFLKNPAFAKMRPKIAVRMPSFEMSNDELNKMVTGWAAQGNVEFPYKGEEFTTTQEELNTGKLLVDKLQCVMCHTIGQKLQPSQMEGSKGLAPDFYHFNRKLRYEWVVELLRDPQKMIPGTSMTAFWAEGQSPFPDILGGNSDAQIRAVAKYILKLGEGKTPPNY